MREGGGGRFRERERGRRDGEGRTGSRSHHASLLLPPHHRQEPPVLLELVAQLEQRLHRVRSGRLLGHGVGRRARARQEGGELLSFRQPLVGFARAGRNGRSAARLTQAGDGSESEYKLREGGKRVSGQGREGVAARRFAHFEPPRRRPPLSTRPFRFALSLCASPLAQAKELGIRARALFTTSTWIADQHKRERCSEHITTF